MNRLLEYRLIFFIYIIYSVGIIGHLTTSLLPYMIAITPYTLFITAAIPFFLFFKYGENRLLLWAAVVFIITFILEVLGVSSGLFFGSYNYSSVLGLSLFDVPIIIGINWVLLILGAILISQRITKNIYLSALLTALFALLFDLLLEPAAIELNYWQWEGGMIPLSNYLTWIGIAFVASLLYHWFKGNTSSLLPIHYFVAQFIFFLLLVIL